MRPTDMAATFKAMSVPRVAGANSETNGMDETKAG